MVDTTRLEKLLGRAPATSSRRAGSVGVPAPRNLALSGHRDMRRDGALRALSPQRLAQVEARWDSLSSFTRAADPDARLTEFNKQARAPEIIALFDVLRTQLAQTFATRRLRTLAISAPISGTGTSFVTAGLLASFARRGEQRVLGLDLNVKTPALHKYFALDASKSIVGLISGEVSPEEHLVKITGRVAAGLGAPTNTEDMLGSTIASQDLSETLDELTADYAPDLIICDLPPMLEGDAVISILPTIDALLLVAHADKTTATDITSCERLLEGNTAFLGVVMNGIHPRLGRRPAG